MNSKSGGSGTQILALAIVIAVLGAGLGGYLAFTKSGTPGAAVTITNTVTSTVASSTATVSPPAPPILSQARVTNITVGPFYAGIAGIVYDSANNNIYAALENLGQVAVVNAATGAVTKTINLTAGDAPAELALDSANGMIYVANDDYSTCSPSTNSTCNIPVISTSTNAVVANIPTPDETSDVAVNPSTNVLYATSNDDDATFVLNAATNHYIGILQNHTQIPDNSEVVAVDSSKNLAFIANSYYHNQPVANVGFLASPSAGGCMFKSTNESNDCVTRSLGVLGGKIDGIAVDPTTGLIYVSNYNLGMVNVISESSGQDVANITVQSPAGIAINPVTDMIFVGSNTTNSAGVDSLYVINGSSNAVLGTVPVGPGTGPDNVAIDSTANTILVSDTSAGTITIIQESSLP